MARPKADPDAVPTKARILAAATDAFATHGFARTRLADVAKAAGIRRPSLLYHFESKTRLYTAVVDHAFEQLGEALDLPMQTGGAFDARLKALVEGFVGFMDTHQGAAGIIVREIVTPDGPGEELLASRGLRLLEAVEGWIRQNGGDRVRGDIDLRRALMQVVSEALLRNASGPRLAALWGDGSVDDAWRLTRATILKPTRERR